MLDRLNNKTLRENLSILRRFYVVFPTAHILRVLVSLHSDISLLVGIVCIEH